MKMEQVQKELQAWGEIIVYTSGGQKFEFHLGDTEFDFDARLIRLKAPNSKFVIDGDEIEVIEMHLGGAED